MSHPAAPPARLLVYPEHAGERVDRVLAALTPLSRRSLRTLMSEGAVQLNGRPLRIQSRTVETGDVLELRLPGETPAEAVGAPPLPEAPAVPILHDDGWLLVVDKPAGILSQPAERRAPGELAMDESTLLHLAAREGKRPFLRLVHRLDRVTSGALLFARCPEALKPLAAAWREGRAERRYLALVEGDPAWQEQVIEAPIGRAPGGGWRFAVLAPEAGGRAARTTVRVLERRGDHTLVECHLSTGRTHQVRVHLAHLGHPVVGDTLYGAAPGAGRPLLHAASLRLPHPQSGAVVEIEAPLPEDFGGGSP